MPSPPRDGRRRPARHVRRPGRTGAAGRDRPGSAAQEEPPGPRADARTAGRAPRRRAARSCHPRRRPVRSNRGESSTTSSPTPSASAPAARTRPRSSTRAEADRSARLDVERADPRRQPADGPAEPAVHDPLAHDDQPWPPHRRAGRGAATRCPAARRRRARARCRRPRASRRRRARARGPAGSPRPDVPSTPGPRARPGGGCRARALPEVGCPSSCGTPAAAARSASVGPQRGRREARAHPSAPADAVRHRLDGGLHVRPVGGGLRRARRRRAEHGVVGGAGERPDPRADERALRLRPRTTPPAHARTRCGWPGRPAGGAGRARRRAPRPSRPRPARPGPALRRRRRRRRALSPTITSSGAARRISGIETTPATRAIRSQRALPSSSEAGSSVCGCSVSSSGGVTAAGGGGGGWTTCGSGSDGFCWSSSCGVCSGGGVASNGTQP